MTAKIRLLLRELRTAHDLSQEEVAQALSISRQSIISLEQGEYLPSSPVLLALMEFFDCQLTELVEGVRIRPINSDHKEENGDNNQMQLAPWSPYQAIDKMQDEMSEMVEHTFGHGDWSRTLGVVTGAMNIHEDDKEYEIKLQVPGYLESDLTIEISDNTLTVAGNKKHEDEKKDGKNLVRREWQYGEFSRQVHFASPIKEEGIEAKLENGTLTVIAPKVEPIKSKIKKIEVKKK
jgi:HSP20 family molecular chaperone IbpA/DNA-binding XRE family transcriptional regulator